MCKFKCRYKSSSLGILGASDYNTPQKFNKSYLQNEQDFYTNGKLDYSKITEELEKQPFKNNNIGTARNRNNF